MTMREAMAAAICRAYTSWALDSMSQETGLKLADAALDALLEPSEEMRALDESLSPTWDNTTAPPRLHYKLGSHTGASFQDMIRAARDGK